MPRRRATRPSTRGITLVESLVILTLLARVALFVYPFLQELHARYKLVSVVLLIKAMIHATRMEAIKACRNAVLHIDIANSRFYSWTEIGAPNFRQDPGELTTHEYSFPPRLPFASRQAARSMDRIRSVSTATTGTGRWWT